MSRAVKNIKRDSHRGSQDVTTDQITIDIVSTINDAIRTLAKLLPKRYWHKKATVALTVGAAGTPSNWSLASDCQEPIIFHYTSSNTKYILEKKDSDREWIKEIWDPAGVVNKPMYYREIGPDSSGYKQIEVFPIPDGSYTLNYEYYKVKGSDLTTSDLASEIPNLPDHVHDAVWELALYIFLKGFDDPNQVNRMADAEMAKKLLEESDEKDQDTDLRLRFGRSGGQVPGFRLS